MPNVVCPACQRASTVPDQFVGQPWLCPHCKVVVPGNAAGPVTAGPAPGPGADPFAGLPQAPPPRTSPVVWLVVGAVCVLGCCVTMIVSVAAIQFLGQQASTTFSTVGKTIDEVDQKPRKR